MINVNDIKRLGLKVDGNVTVGRSLSFEPPVVINNGVSIDALEIGAYSYIGPAARIFKATIGRYCSVAGDVTIGDGDHPVDRLTTSPVTYVPAFSWYKPSRPTEPWREPYRTVTIGHDVWIGTNVVIFGGVQIGAGAIIGAGAVVRSNVEPYSIVGGVPARVLRFRFPDRIISRLLTLAWWNYDLVEWMTSGQASRVTEIDDQAVDRLEEAISAGHLPMLSAQIRRLNRDSQRGLVLL
jgi:acetyltransferase-like isoleucine patch superfamily enzyme